MLENVSVFIPDEIEKGPRGQKSKTSNGELLAFLADQHLVELRLERVQMENIGGGVALLLVGQSRRTPIRGLLLLRELDTQQLAAEILQPVLIGKGARQFRGDLGAIDRRRHRAQIVRQDGDVEAPEMEDL